MAVRRGDTHKYSLGSCNSLNSANFRRAATQNCLSYRGFKIYNILPNEIKEENNIEKFSKAVVEWIRNNIKI